MLKAARQKKPFDEFEVGPPPHLFMVLNQLDFYVSIHSSHRIYKTIIYTKEVQKNSFVF